MDDDDRDAPTSQPWSPADAVPGLMVFMLLMFGRLAWATLASLTAAPTVPVEGNVTRVCINDCGPSELQMLPSIGPHLAKRILQHRRIHGRFESWNDLDEVPGIGPATIAAIAPWLDFSRQRDLGSRATSDATKPWAFDDWRVAQSR
ncbi:MAG: helix-hairpin-helix domain-containing protein [Planctomycetota bacterium]